MGRYAEGTTVSVANSRSEIERTLARYGVVERGWVDVIGKSSIQFRMADRMVRFVLELPDPMAEKYVYGRHHKLRSPEARRAAWEQDCRQHWRALSLAIKAKLEAVESGIATFEQEFMAYIILPNGESVAEHVTPAIAEAYETKKMPPLLGFK